MQVAHRPVFLKLESLHVIEEQLRTANTHDRGAIGCDPRGGLGRKAALALVIAGVVLAACGGPIEGPVAANPAT